MNIVERLTAGLLLLPFVFHAVFAVDIPIEWTLGVVYEDEAAAVGDKVIFNYVSAAHNVFLHADQSCDFANSEWIGTDSPTEYTFDGPGTYTFACQVGAHCENGMIITFNVVEPEQEPSGGIPIEWTLGVVYDDRTAEIGETVVFNYADGAHNVYRHADQSCDFANSELVGASPPTQFTFEEAGTYTFACQVGAHCENGMIVTFTVDGPPAADTETPVAAPPPETDAPVAAPPPPPPADTQAPTLSPTVTFEGNTVNVQWIVTGTYEDTKVNLGDRAIFTYSNAHTLFLHQDKSCDFAGSRPLGGPGNSPVVYEFNEVGEFTFACQVVAPDGRSHCNQGQIITFTVVDPTAPTEQPTQAPVGLALTENVDWRLGVTYEDRNVLVGSIAIFEYTPNHNVFQHVDKSCDRTNSVEIADLEGSPVEILFDTLGSFTYACQVGNHCDQGMLITFNVLNELPPAPPPTPAPVSDPTPSPVAAPDFPAGEGSTIPIIWEIRQYSDVAVNVGDTIEFSYLAIHDVHLHQDRSCDTLNSQEIGAIGSTSATFTFEEEGEFTFACQQGTHCAVGQIITFVVGQGNPPPTPPAAGNMIDIVWRNVDPYDDMDVEVGDKVVFTYQPNHNVFLHADKSCDFAGSTQVGGNDDSPATFEFTEPGSFTFACQVGSHCENNGQIITFTVTEPGSGGGEGTGGGNSGSDDGSEDDGDDNSASSSSWTPNVLFVVLGLLSWFSM